jgi:hypothetical protein
MIRFSTIILIIITFLSCSRNLNQSSNLDFSAMDEFWKITSILAKDIEPNDEDWNSLFNTPGYSILTESEFTQDYFKNYFRLAYMPGKKELLQKELEKSHWRISYLKHMTNVLPEKEKIKNHRKELLSSNSLTNEVLKVTNEYFLEDYLITDDLPQISFVVFGNDARGYSNIIIDILLSIEQGNKLKYLVGHEAHHFYRNKQLKFNFPEENHSDYNLIWVLNQIHAEGIADQIDKRVNFFNDGDQENSRWAKTYRDHLEKTPEIIKKMDSLLVQYSNQSSDLGSLSEELQNIVPMSGHPTGYYMTRAIIDHFGENKLLKDIGNPFQFFRLYNQVTQKNTEQYPMFSKQTMKLINNLEQKYLKKTNEKS